MAGTIGTILFQNGWDITGVTRYDSILKKVYSLWSLPIMSSTTGVYGYGSAVSIGGSGTAGALENYISSTNELTLCTHMYTQNTTLFRFGNSEQLKVSVKFNNASRKIELYTGSNAGTLVATSSGTYNLNVWLWVNIYIKIADSTSGVIEVRIDNDGATNFVSYTGDTKPGASDQIDYFQLLTNDANTVSIWDNTLVHSGTTYPNNFISERRMVTLVPTGNGGSVNGATGFVPSTGSNWSTVDETALNTGDYNLSSTIGAIDVFTRNSTGLISSIDSVSHVITASKDDVGTRTLKSFIVIGATGYQSSNINLTANAYSYSVIWKTSPDTNVAWTNSEINSAKFGYKDNS